jgi:ABC-type dipeptide/oligopeptide/nickel transport system ATPase component
MSLHKEFFDSILSEKNHVTAIIGSSGQGKTTLALMLYNECIKRGVEASFKDIRGDIFSNIKTPTYIIKKDWRGVKYGLETLGAKQESLVFVDSFYEWALLLNKSQAELISEIKSEVFSSKKRIIFTLSEDFIKEDDDATLFAEVILKTSIDFNSKILKVTAENMRNDSFNHKKSFFFPISACEAESLFEVSYGSV